VSISVLFACGTEKKEVVTNSIAQDLKSTKAATDTIIEQTMFKVTNDSLSVLKWTGSTFIKSHFGTVNFEGALGIFEGKLVSGDLTFDMNTINTEDLNGGKKQKLDDHLKGEDFFDVEKFSKAYLKIKNYDGKNITGDLTIKEVTKEISFPAILEITQNSITGKADFTINRTEYGIIYSSGNFFDLAKDRIISDNITFNVSIKAIK
tara:strand:+ start:112 stop:729 length:618 start_codon:yes stop_codon:yes gene_type:complete